MRVGHWREVDFLRLSTIQAGILRSWIYQKPLTCSSMIIRFPLCLGQFNVFSIPQSSNAEVNCSLRCRL